MANNVLRQYRSALKAYEKKISEFVSREGRVYSSEYYEFQERIGRLETQIKNKTYTNRQLQNMINKMKSRSISVEHTRQYSAEKDKFVRTTEAPVYEKRQGNQPPTIGQAKQEVIRRERIVEQEGSGEAIDYNGALFTEIYNWCKIQAPKGIVKELLAVLDKLSYTDMRAIRAFERAANKVGIDHIPYGYEDIDKLYQTALLALAIYELPEDSPMWDKLKEWQAQRGSNSEYDTTEFGGRK